MVNNKLYEKTGKCVMLVNDLKIFYLFSFAAYSAQVGGGPEPLTAAMGLEAWYTEHRDSFTPMATQKSPSQQLD